MIVSCNFTDANYWLSIPRDFKFRNEFEKESEHISLSADLVGHATSFVVHASLYGNVSNPIHKHLNNSQSVNKSNFYAMQIYWINMPNKNLDFLSIY